MTQQRRRAVFDLGARNPFLCCNLMLIVHKIFIIFKNAAPLGSGAYAQPLFSTTLTYIYKQVFYHSIAHDYISIAVIVADQAYNVADN